MNSTWWYDPVVYMGTLRAEVIWWSSCTDTPMIAGESAIMNGYDMEGGLEMPELAPEYPDWILETSFDQQWLRHNLWKP